MISPEDSIWRHSPEATALYSVMYLYYTPNLKLACFVLYLKIINALFFFFFFK